MAGAPDLSGRVFPDLGETRRLAADANVIPISLTVTEDCETPVSALLKLRGEGPCFLLESVERGTVGRYSFVGLNPRAILRWQDGTLREYPGDFTGAADLTPPVSETPAPDPYAAVSEYLAQFRVADLDSLPPFSGGLVGLFGYDLVRSVEPLGDLTPIRSAFPTLP